MLARFMAKTAILAAYLAPVRGFDAPNIQFFSQAALSTSRCELSDCVRPAPRIWASEFFSSATSRARWPRAFESKLSERNDRDQLGLVVVQALGML